MHRLLRHVATAAALALTLTACGGDSDDATDIEDPVAATEEEAEADEDPADAAEDADDEAPDEEGGTVVETASIDLGEVLVDADGMTLYLFDPDEQGPSTCYDECESNWPPLLTEDEPVASGEADQGLLGTVERDDGTMQVTYDGWPLYHWAADEAAGDATGQGVQDVWWVVEPDGSPIRDTDAAADGEAESAPSY